MDAVTVRSSRADYPTPADAPTALVAERICNDDARRSDQAFSAELISLTPQLRSFTRLLSDNRDSAEDLAQETLARAWRHRRGYRPGTNMRAWLLTIARNTSLTLRRRAWREAPFDQAAAENIPSAGVDQIWSMELADTLQALRRLPDQLQEALVLVGAGGCSYEEAAKICDCPVGTAKSRVSRARRALLARLDAPPSPDDLRRNPERAGARLGVARSA